MTDKLELKLKGQNRLVAKLQLQRDKLSNNNPALRQAFLRAGMLLVNQAKLNIRRHGLIDQGRLLNSIRFEPFRTADKQGIRVGSFGVPYAAFWEFGFVGQMRVRGHNRLITQAFGNPISPTVVRVSPHTRFRNQRAKPYLRPAYERHQQRITELLMEAFGGN